MQHYLQAEPVLLVVVGWLYVVLMMSVAEATSSNGTVLGAVFTFLLYGVGPLAIVVYIMGTPGRKRAIRAREKEELDARAAAEAAQRSADPDAGGKPPADAVPPVRKEP